MAYATSHALRYHGIDPSRVVRWKTNRSLLHSAEIQLLGLDPGKRFSGSMRWKDLARFTPIQFSLFSLNITIDQRRRMKNSSAIRYFIVILHNRMFYCLLTLFLYKYIILCTMLFISSLRFRNQSWRFPIDVIKYDIVNN